MRTIIDLPPQQVEALAEICRREGISRAEAIRRAVADLVEREREGRKDRAFGLWKRRPVDGVTYQRRVRREWAG